MRATISRPTAGLSGAGLARTLPLVGVALGTALLVWPALAHAVEVWSTDAEFSYGFFVLPTALLLVWWRRAALRRNLGPGTLAGLPIVIAALALYLLARRLDINALVGLAVIPLRSASSLSASACIAVCSTQQGLRCKR
jgi:hypothetical protein